MAGQTLRDIHAFPDLVRYLEDELDWPLQEYGFDELTFEFTPAELGLREEDAARVKAIHQLRPLASGQPWGIFFVEFENKKLPVVVLRRILSHLVIKKRDSANKATAPAWHAEDLLFVTAFGEDNTDNRDIAFAHFHQNPGDLPTLHVLGWDGGDTPLKLANVDRVLHERLRWPEDETDTHAWRENWSKPFKHKLGHTIRTADLLAEELARLARGIRDKAKRMLAAETERGALTKLFKAFQTALIHDLTPESFADTYAQTITYGLLTAAISRTEMSEGRYGTFVKADDIADIVPVTNPFLKEMLQTFLKAGGRKGGIDFDELGIQDVVELLRGDETDLPAVIADFGNKNPNEDPVIHFYEHFLAAYDKPQKKQRGVFYTPQPVVSYIVRSVHELLQSEFGLEDGLASTITWGEMTAKARHSRESGNPVPPSDFTIPAGTSPDAPFVTILDPATGTATFLVEVINVIHRTLTEKWKKQGMSEAQRLAAWNDYVPKDLLPRLYGYELMMAPYAIAHMKIGLKLFETGYRFVSEERVRVYLTNALEPAHEVQPQLESLAPALAHEAQAVAKVKQVVRFTVVIGNPPYSAISANLTSENRRIVDRYRAVNGVRIQERSMLQFEKNIQDDYIKFIAIAQSVIEASNVGIVGYVTNHSYLDGPTLRGMRNNLSSMFSRLRFLDLHGNTNKKESYRGKDENVFDIQQGVSIALLSKRIDVADTVCSIGHLWGTRREKYANLDRANIDTISSKQFTPDKENYYFIAFESDLGGEYQKYQKLTDLLRKNLTGTTTGFDALLMDFDRERLLLKLERFADPQFSDSIIRDEFSAHSGHAAAVLANRRSMLSGDWKSLVKPFQLFPFDFRWVYLKQSLLQGHRFDVMENLGDGKPGLLAMRQTKEGFGVFAVTGFCGHKLLGSYDRNYVFPLYDSLFAGMSFLDLRAIHSVQKEKVNVDLPAEIEVLNYAYAIFYSNSYRTRYAEFLKIDFPRLPLTGSLKFFRALAQLGSELVALHLLESPKVNAFITRFEGQGDNSLPKKPVYKDGAVWINTSQRFEGVPETVWNFHVGGYQVCEKWLKDRKGRTLSADDITHYQRVVAALNETIRLMAEIDRVIEAHGGWPTAFASNIEAGAQT